MTAAGEPEAITRVLIVDDSAAVRKDLRTLLELMDGIRVVGCAASAASALQQARRLEPDIVLLDLALGDQQNPANHDGEGLDGLSSITVLKDLTPPPAVYVLTVHGYPRAEQAAMRAGADAFFVKGRDSASLIDHIRSFHASARCGMRRN